MARSNGLKGTYTYPKTYSAENDAKPSMAIYIYNTSGSDRSNLRTRIGIGRVPADMLYNISLPVPTQGLTLTENHEWEDVAGLAGGWWEAFFADFGDIIKEAMPSITNRLFQNKVPNDLVSLMYKGPSLRSFTFSWDLIANSREDVNEIENIVRAIRAAAYPSAGTGEFLKWHNEPEFFRIELLLPHGASTDQLGSPLFFSDYSVITSITTTYTGDDEAFNVFPDGKPVIVNLTITTQELFRQDKYTLFGIKPDDDAALDGKGTGLQNDNNQGVTRNGPNGGL